MENNNIIEIVGENYTGSFKSTRYASRGIVIQDGNILLSHELKNDLWMIPGGGREADESDVECVIREIAEETGYIVVNKKQTVSVFEYYEDVRYVSVYFICKVVGETTPHLTEGEKENELERRWILLQETLSIFSKHNDYKDIFEEKRGLYFREYTALTKMIENKDI